MWSSVLILFCYVFRRRSILLNLCSVTGIIFIYLFCLVRMLVPIELPWTIPVSGGRIYNRVYWIMKQELFHFLEHPVTVAHVIAGIWLAGVLMLLLLYIRQYYKAFIYFGQIKQTSDPEVQAAFQKVCGGKPGGIVVIQTPAVEIPCCMGLIRKRILIPDKPYSERELYYIILHEYNHLCNRDILLMQLVNILTILFWWNPFIYLLKKDINQNIEIRCDQMVVKKISQEERADYLAVILKEFQETVEGYRTGKKYAGIAQLLEQHGSGMVERFEKVAGMQKETSKKGTFILSTIVAIVLVVSYSWILQPYYEPTQDDYRYEDKGATDVDIEDAYIYEKNGKYYVHCKQGDALIEDKKHLKMLQKSGFIMKEKRK